MMEVLVFGSAIVDFICYVNRLPKAGETLHGSKFANGFGGKGANQCVAAAKLGARTAMIAKLGDDSWGANYVQHLRDEGVNVEHVKQCKGETTGIAQISVSSTGENHIVIVAGANSHLSCENVAEAKDLFDNAKILICQLETPLAATLTALRTFRGISILNAAPALADTPQDLIAAATIFCVNESEAALTIGGSEITTLEQAKQALLKLLTMGANIAIITLGALGAVYAERIEATQISCIHVPTRKAEKVLDTTGAGDAFIGSLAYYMARFPGFPMHQHIGAACEIASYSVQKAGTQSSFPTARQVDIELSKRKFDWCEI